MNNHDPHDYTKLTSTLSANESSADTSNTQRVEVKTAKSQSNGTMHALCHAFMMIGSVITFIRNFVFNTIFLLLAFAIFVAVNLGSSDKTEIAAASNQSIKKNQNSPILLLDLTGDIKETPSSDDDFSKFTRELNEALNNTRETDVLTVEKALNKLKKDNKIKEVFVDVSSIGSVSMPVAARIAKAISQVRSSTKIRFTAYAGTYSAGGYLIANACNQIVIHPLGSLGFKGMSMSSLYFKDALDKYYLEPMVFKAGEFKSAVEPFTNSSMSPQVKEEYTKILNGLWSEYKQHLTAPNRVRLSRLLSRDERFLENLNDCLGNEADLLLKNRLITKTLDRYNVNRQMRAHYRYTDQAFDMPMQNF
ncbi:MAG: S49 family peptidase, partial [Succinivibrio sp.]